MVVISDLILAVALLYVGSFPAPTLENVKLPDCYKRKNVTYVGIRRIYGKKDVTEAECTQLCKENEKCQVSGVGPRSKKCYLFPLPVVFLSYTMTAEQCVSKCTEMGAECKTIIYPRPACILHNILLKDMPINTVFNVTKNPTFHTWYLLAEKTC